MNLKKEFDCHVHFYGGSLEILKKWISNSPYASKYMCYHCVDLQQVEQQKQLESGKIYFMIPFVLKETDIGIANKQLLIYSNEKDSIIQFPLLGDSIENYEKFRNFGGMKEHFLIHSWERYNDRFMYYDYLNSKRKVLIIHCKDDIRIDYIKRLRRDFPFMYIQIAHLGVNRKDIMKTEKLLYEFQNDISTVSDFDFIIKIFPTVKNQVLYGTDSPYVNGKNLKRQEVFYQLNSEMMEYMRKNARKLLTVIYRAEL